DSPIFSRFGVTVTNKLVHGYITDGMREHIVCATPNYDTCSWDIRGDGIYFIYCRKAGLTVIVR
ncbi:MAG: hypothetical protein ILO34_00275, partial [Kiritimatiellae bacterium]|nr:hypothetical protein [Kiritimatiellia bacterium]